MVVEDIKNLNEWALKITKENLPYINLVRKDQKEYNNPLTLITNYNYVAFYKSDNFIRGVVSFPSTTKEITLQEFKQFYNLNEEYNNSKQEIW